MNKADTLRLFEECENHRARAFDDAFTQMSLQGMKDEEAVEKARKLARDTAKKHWNAWATEITKQLKALTLAGNELKPREFKKRQSNGTYALETREEWLNRQNPHICAWIDSALVNFSDMKLVPFNQAYTDGRDNAEALKYFLRDSVLFVKNGQFDFRGFIFPGEVDFSNSVFSGGDVSFAGARFTGAVNFLRTEFRGLADFSWATFNNDACFREARFREIASFCEAHFYLDANFDEAEFLKDVFFVESHFSSHEFARNGDAPEGSTKASKPETDSNNKIFRRCAQFSETRFLQDALFSGSKFFGDAKFVDSRFSEHAEFTSAEFWEDVTFSQAAFRGLAEFRQAKFQKDASFVAILGERGFDMSSAHFAILPDFTQAHFTEGPRLDDFKHSRLDDTSFWKSLIFRKHREERREAKKRTTARFRALKRLAIQTHDHEQERRFFEGELRALRCTYNWFDLRLIFSFLYQLLSNFGSSIRRPIFGWLTMLVCSAAFYWGRYLLEKGYYDIRQIGTILTALITSEPTPLECVKGDGSPLSAAFGVAFSHATINLVNGYEDKLKQSYACLYGFNKGFVTLNDQELIPLIPDWVAVIGALQSLFSLVMLFLLALALRNHFRIT